MGSNKGKKLARNGRPRPAASAAILVALLAGVGCLAPGRGKPGTEPRGRTAPAPGPPGGAPTAEIPTDSGAGPLIEALAKANEAAQLELAKMAKQLEEAAKEREGFAALLAQAEKELAEALRARKVAEDELAKLKLQLGALEKAKADAQRELAALESHLEAIARAARAAEAQGTQATQGPRPPPAAKDDAHPLPANGPDILWLTPSKVVTDGAGTNPVPRKQLAVALRLTARTPEAPVAMWIIKRDGKVCGADEISLHPGLRSLGRLVTACPKATIEFKHPGEETTLEVEAWDVNLAKSTSTAIFVYSPPPPRSPHPPADAQ